MIGVKESNPKDVLGMKKVPFSAIPMPVIAELGVAMAEGAMKYARHNYRAVGVRASVYFDAEMRHMAAWWEGQDLDPDSGVNHVTKAIACLVVLRDSMIQGNWVDDRPPRTPEGWLEPLNSKMMALIDKYPGPKAPYTEKNSAAQTSGNTSGVQAALAADAGGQGVQAAGAPSPQ